VSDTSAENLVVLVVDDNRVIRDLVTRQLHKLGLGADVAVDGKEALAKLDERDYNLILMDVQMPEMDGIECTQLIRKRDETAGRHTKIVALTGYGSRVECIQAGMDDFIAKPMNIATLKAMLERWLPEYQPVPSG
jgi:CheY-like chemotaxis protein